MIQSPASAWPPGLGAQSPGGCPGGPRPPSTPAAWQVGPDLATSSRGAAVTCPHRGRTWAQEGAGAPRPPTRSRFLQTGRPWGAWALGRRPADGHSERRVRDPASPSSLKGGQASEPPGALGGPGLLLCRTHGVGQVGPSDPASGAVPGTKGPALGQNCSSWGHGLCWPSLGICYHLSSDGGLRAARGGFQGNPGAGAGVGETVSS